MATSKISEFFKSWFGPDDLHVGGRDTSRNNAARTSAPRSTSPNAARPLDRVAARSTTERPSAERLSSDRETVIERPATPERVVEPALLIAPAVGSLDSSDLRGTSPAATSNVERLRFRGARGGIIARHRSMRTVEMPRSEIYISIALAVIATFVWLLALPLVMGFWRATLSFAGGLMGLPGQLRVEKYNLGPIDFDLPSLALPSRTPDLTMMWVTAIVTVVLFLASYLLMRRSVPLAYMLRAMLFVQLASLFFFVFWPTRYPYGLEDYMANMLMASLAFLTCVPLILALTYYIFDLGLLKKLFLTFMTIAHLCVLAPLQYLLHTYLIYHGSLLFMPVLYLVFGLPLSIMSLVAFYSWGMSWKSRNVPSAA